jgi:microcystin-dependent protein
MWDDAFIGEIKLFAGNFPPQGYAVCDGSIMPISQNAALFSLLGTMYGGNGVTTFALPDLRGRVPMGVGQGPGLTRRDQGVPVGAETATQLTSPVVTSVQGEGVTPTTGLAVVPTPQTGNANVSTVPPALPLMYIICINGIYPSRW